MENFFKLKQNKTTVRREVIGGLTTFVSMAYIFFLNPQILGQAGVPTGAVFLAAIIVAVFGTLLMGLYANVPFALAPGIGMQAYFTYTIVFGFGFSWQEALAVVFLVGLVDIVITMTHGRQAIVRGIPAELKAAIGGGIGLFVTYIGLKNAGFINYLVDAKNVLSVNDSAYHGSFPSKVSSILAGGGVTPELAKFNSASVLLALIGLVILVVLMMRKVPAAFLITLILTTLIGIPMGVTATHLSPATSLSASFTSLQDVFGQAWGAKGMGSLFSNWHHASLALITIFAMGLTGLFDAIGTLIGIGNQTGIFSKEDQQAFEHDHGFNSKMDRALVVDTFTTTLAGVAGTSNTTTFIESATGVGAGARTGLANVVTAIGFAAMVVLAPLVSVVPTAATAPLLILVGISMMGEFKKIAWDKLEVALPAFFTSVFMAFAYSISYGIAAGFIFYIIVKYALGKFKDVSPVLLIVSAFFLANFVILAFM
ncbi:NCS2 family permease [Eupransor demetentiae]|uniref:Nucleobase:cation symporter 2 ( NCS2) family (NCS2) n=1 Tax=Eupransor demetentiae TaxID=3109584 RepID=A0ABM9N3K8_9LACO|nr:Xanthine/guanine/uracil/vitamin C permease GhxP/GhxQ [Lactobacillaceae bacterium LMG 33000]